MRQPILWLLPLMVIGLILTQYRETESAAALDATAFTISNGQFGLAFVNSAEHNRSVSRIQRGVNAGAKLDRFPFYWANIEPNDNQWNWGSQDAALAANEGQGLGTLAILLGTSPAHYPREVSVQSVAPMPQIGGGPLRQEVQAEIESAVNGCEVQGTPAPRGLYEPIFSDGTDVPATTKTINDGNPWARFVENAVQRYRPGGTAGRNVRYWEIWNEPDLCHFWGGTPQEYARMLKVAYLVIKNRDPQATVIWGGMALYGPKYEGGANFLNEFVGTLAGDPMAAQYGGFFDAMTIHQYSNVVHGYNYTNKVRSAVRGAGWDGKPVWVTEAGVPVCDTYPGPDCPSPYRANERDQASYVLQNIAYTRLAHNDGPIFFFQLHDDGGNECRQSPPADGFGLVTNEPGAECVPHNADPRLSYTAHQLAARYLADTVLIWADIQDGKVRRVAFYDPATKERRLLTWAIGGSDATAIIPAAGTSARKITFDEAETTITPSGGVYNVPVSRATNQSQPNSSTYTIGGKPYILVERDTLPPTASFTALLPVSTSPFNVTWLVQDYGSFIVPNSVDVWVQDNDGPWVKWRTAQAGSGTAAFSGEIDHRYKFGITARDDAGNAITNPSVLAETLVTDQVPLAYAGGVVRVVDGNPAAFAPVSFGGGTAYSTSAGQFGVLAPLGAWDLEVNNHMVVQGRTHNGDTNFDVVMPPFNNVVMNGQFESSEPGSGPAGWDVGGSSPVGVVTQPNTLDNAVQLATSFVPAQGVPGSDGSNGGNSTITQHLTVTASNPWLSFHYKVDSDELAGDGTCDNSTVHDQLEVVIAVDGPGQQPHYVYCQETGSGWQNRFINLSDFAGQSITLIFNVYESSPNRRTTATIDNIFIGSPETFPERQELFLPLVTK